MGIHGTIGLHRFLWQPIGCRRLLPLGGRHVRAHGLIICKIDLIICNPSISLQIGIHGAIWLFAFFGSLLVVAGSYRLELVMCVLTVFSISTHKLNNLNFTLQMGIHGTIGLCRLLWHPIGGRRFLSLRARHVRAHRFLHQRFRIYIERPRPRVSRDIQGRSGGVCGVLEGSGRAV